MIIPVKEGRRSEAKQRQKKSRNQERCVSIYWWNAIPRMTGAGGQVKEGGEGEKGEEGRVYKEGETAERRLWYSTYDVTKGAGMAHEPIP
jgi:hypothetical protein